MPEFRTVQHADRSPSMCVACGANKGPFIDLDVTTFSIATPSGWTPIVDGSVYLCLGTSENPGCAVQIGRNTRLLIDRVEFEALALEADALREEVRDLKQIAKKKTLTLEDAERVFAPVAEF